MGKIKSFYNKLNISMKITLPLYLGMLVRLPCVLGSHTKLSILIGLIPYAIIYPMVRKKPSEFSEAEKNKLYKASKFDKLYFITYLFCLDMDLALMYINYEPKWAVIIFVAIVLSIVSLVTAHYFTLISAIHNELNTNKGE